MRTYLDNGNYIVTFNQTPQTGTAVNVTTSASMPINSVNSIQLNFQNGYTIPWTNSSGRNMGSGAILNTSTNTLAVIGTRVYPNNITLTLSAFNTFLLPSTTYSLNFEFFNVGI